MHQGMVQVRGQDMLAKVASQPLSKEARPSSEKRDSRTLAIRHFQRDDKTISQDSSEPHARHCSRPFWSQLLSGLLF